MNTNLHQLRHQRGLGQNRTQKNAVLIGLVCLNCLRPRVFKHTVERSNGRVAHALVCAHCGCEWIGMSKAEYARLIQSAQYSASCAAHTEPRKPICTTKEMSAEAETLIGSMTERMLNLEAPQTRGEWLSAVDLVRSLIFVETARAYGLVTGGPNIDGERCRAILACGVKRGVSPSAAAVDRMVQLLK